MCALYVSSYSEVKRLYNVYQYIFSGEGEYASDMHHIFSQQEGIRKNQKREGKGRVAWTIVVGVCFIDRTWRSVITLLRKLQGVGNSTFVLSVENDNDFRSRCE